ncbi:MAG: isoprenylcysteine carboxylmethyltransferase family protein [bacterium]|nr:isoprenylcysteine carboxylmethyltransferase family protein [bacterium]
MTDTEEKQVEIESHGKKGAVRELLRTVFHIAILLSAAGELYWINAWVYYLYFLLMQLVYFGVLKKFNPELINERAKLLRADTKKFDKWFYALSVPVMVTALVLTGIDRRFGWSDVPLYLNITGFLIMFFTSALAMWAIAVNRHFETSVRIQTDRDHKICKKGPYKYVRHPGYVGMVFGWLGFPLFLGTVWTFIPGAVMGLLAIFRTFMEDRTLQNELPGYKEYTLETKYRLMPLVW